MMLYCQTVKKNNSFILLTVRATCRVWWKLVTRAVLVVPHAFGSIIHTKYIGGVQNTPFYDGCQVLRGVPVVYESVVTDR